MTVSTLLAPELNQELAPPACPAAQSRASAVGSDLRGIEFALIRDRAGFDALEADWNALFDRAGASHQLFLSFNWLWHWCNHYLDGTTELAVLAVRRAGKLVLVWPLVRSRSAGLSVLTWMGDPVSQYGDVLVEQGPGTAELLRQSWDHIRRTVGADVAYLRKVRADAAVAPLMAHLDGTITETAEAPYLDLSSADGFAAYEQRYSGSARRNRRRLARRLDEQGKITFEEMTSGQEARDLIKLAVTLKREWLAAKGLISKAYADDRFIRFFADAADPGNRAAGCRVAVLKSAGRPVSIEVAIRHKERVALHIIVFDLEFEKAGAGVLLLEQSIRNAADQGAGCYDLLAPGDSYKLDWADGSMAVRDWALPMSAVGRAYARLYLGALRARLKRMIAMLPTGVRRRIAEHGKAILTRA